MGEKNWFHHLSVQRYTIPRLTIEERNQAIGRLQAGESQTDVATHYNMSQSTIRRLFARFQESNSFADQPRSRQPRATTRAQDRLFSFVTCGIVLCLPLQRSKRFGMSPECPTRRHTTDSDKEGASHIDLF